MSRPVLRAPMAIWAAHAALLLAGIVLLGGLAFGPLALMVWGVVEVTYLAVVLNMAARGGITGAAAVHIGSMAATLPLLAVLGLALPWLWGPMLALLVATIFEVAVVISARPVPLQR